MRYNVSWIEVYDRIDKFMKTERHKCPNNADRIYGIPRGGQIIAGLTGRAVDNIEDADIVVDDIKDSGKTSANYESVTGLPVICMFDKSEPKFEGKWLVFPWEVNDSGIEDVVTRQLQYIGEDVKREGLRDTPSRVIKSYSELYKGYDINLDSIFKAVFSEKCDEMVLLKDIELYSTCEHHLLPFFGKAHVAYIPNKKVIGISKLARLIECFSRRVQIQERIGNEVVDALQKYLEPKGSACVIEAQHFCMMSRGIQKQNSVMVTSAIRGVFQDDLNARQELFNLIRMK